MPTKIEITCFTDLKGSTAFTEEKGHHRAIRVLEEHLRIGQSLAALNAGKYVKNIGDAHMVRFDYVEDALAFALQLQQLCSNQPGFDESPIPVRISLYLGAVEPVNEDVFGSGVNQAARLQSVTEPSQVTVNKDLFEAMQKVFGKPEAEELCTSLGPHELKGIPGQQELFRFEWRKYLATQPKASITTPLYEHLRLANIELSNLTASDLSRPGQVIWPIVPRDLATAIHRGQIELIRLLVLAGWEVTVLIADCGGEIEYDNGYVGDFEQSIKSHAALRKIRLPKIVRMRDLYEPGYKEYKHVQSLFRRITSQMTVDVLIRLNGKGYAEDVKEKIEGKPTLTYLQPPLTLAAVIHLVTNAQTKCAVVAGFDEKEQWEQAYNMGSVRAQVGILMIPVVKMDPVHQIYQQKTLANMAFGG